METYQEFFVGAEECFGGDTVLFNLSSCFKIVLDSESLVFQSMHQSKMTSLDARSRLRDVVDTGFVMTACVNQTRISYIIRVTFLRALPTARGTAAVRYDLYNRDYDLSLLSRPRSIHTSPVRRGKVVS